MGKFGWTAESTTWTPKVVTGNGTFVIRTKEEAKRFLDLTYKVGKPVAVDTEYGRSPDNKLSIKVWSLSWGKKIRACLYADASLDVFKPWLEDASQKKVLWNYTADREPMNEVGIKFKGFHADAMVMDAIVDTADVQHGLKHAVHKYFGRKRLNFQDVFSFVPEGKKQKVMYSWDEIFASPLLLRKMWEYSADDAEDTIMLYWHHRKILEHSDWNYWPKFLKEDVPFTITLYRMMQRGFPIDLPYLSDLEKKLRARMLRQERVFRELVEEPELNLRSGPQLQKLFFDKLSYPALRLTKKGRNTPRDQRDSSTFSINKEVLEKWAEAGLELGTRLMEYREVEKICGTFVTGVLNSVEEDGKLYSDLNQIGAATGRISSRKYEKWVRVLKKQTKKAIKAGEPVEHVLKQIKIGANLQNIPIRSELGKLVRNAFVAGEGYKLVVADYSGEEWWIMAHLSQDKNMLKQAHDKIDPHAFTAKEVWGLDCPVEEVKATYPERRVQGKTCNFGFIYGCGEDKAALLLGCTVEEARDILKKFFKLYPGIHEYHRDRVRECKKYGYVTIASGRRRHIPDIHTDDQVVRGHAERTAINTPDQGFAADILKRAMNMLERDPVVKELGGELLIAVHDEIVWSVSEENAEKLKERVIPIMESSYKEILTVPLPVEATICDRWGQK